MAKDGELWRRRLYVPFYKVSEAARYADSTTQTVGRWSKLNATSKRESRAELTYLQLIEVAVVAAMRRAGIKLDKIRDAHSYFGKVLESEFPFAEHRFMAVGGDIAMDYAKIDPDAEFESLIKSGGQLGWSELLKPLLKEFDYEDEGLATRWRVAGLDSEIAIDPRISFGAPQINGVATWSVRGRYDAGESVDDISDDLGLDSKQVIEALKFEGLKADLGRQSYWVN